MLFHFSHRILHFLLFTLILTVGTYDSYSQISEADSIAIKQVLGEAISDLQNARLEEAENKIQTAKDIYQKHFTHYKHKLWSDILFVEGNKLAHLGNYSAAIDTLIEVLKIRQANSPDACFSCSQIYNTLGFIYFQTYEFEESIINYEKSLALGKVEFGEGSPDVAIIKNNIGNSLSSMGRLEAALQNHLEALEVLKPLEKDYLADLGRTYSGIANISAKHFPLLCQILDRIIFPPINEDAELRLIAKRFFFIKGVEISKKY